MCLSIAKLLCRRGGVVIFTDMKRYTDSDGKAALTFRAVASVRDTELCKRKHKHLSPSLMDKTKSRLAAFFDNDEDESSFPVRRIEPFFLFLRAHYSLLQ